MSSRECPTVNILLRAVEFAFGCRHNQLSRVFTIDRRTYRVCFDCGQEVRYSLEFMRSVSPYAGDIPYRALHGAPEADASPL